MANIELLQRLELPLIKLNIADESLIFCLLSLYLLSLSYHKRVAVSGGATICRNILIGSYMWPNKR